MKEADDLIIKFEEMVEFLLNPTCNEDEDATKYNKLKKQIQDLKEKYREETTIPNEINEINEIPKKEKLQFQRMITPHQVRKMYEEETQEFPVDLDYKGKLQYVDLDYVDWLECKLIEVLRKLNEKIRVKNLLYKQNE